MPVEISDRLTIPDDEIELNAVRSQGAGGQNVNKVSSAIHLRFDVKSSSLPLQLKQRLLQSTDSRISSAGVIIIKAQQHRSQEKNREEALQRLEAIVKAATQTRKRRVATKPTFGSQQKRLKGKTLRGKLKQLRSSIEE